MENLLCNEVWIMSPIVTKDNMHGIKDDDSFCYQDEEEDLEQTFAILFEKEATYMPKQGYVMQVNSNDLIISARFKAICWLVKSQKRLKLSMGTVFMAANYLDRFISLNQCQGWRSWMFELLSIACLSVASKFNETSFVPLGEFQMEGINIIFETSLIQRMELTLVKALRWRLSSTTPYSFVETLTSSFHKLNKTLSERVNELLLRALLDIQFVEFRPCVTAVSAIAHIFEQSNYAYDLTHVVSLIPEDYKDDLTKCKKMMEKHVTDDHCNNNYCPSSPVTVLAIHQFDSSCCCQFHRHVDKMPQGDATIRSSKRRKIEE